MFAAALSKMERNRKQSRPPSIGERTVAHTDHEILFNDKTNKP